MAKAKKEEDVELPLESTSEPAPAPAPEPTLEELAVQNAAQVVADAKATLDGAVADHKAAVEVHKAAVAALEPKAEYGKHILVDFGASGDYVLRDAPDGTNEKGEVVKLFRERALRLDGVNVEHVGEDVNGVWQYRKM